MNYFDKIFIRLTLGLLSVSVVLDIVWLIMYSKAKWSPPAVANESIYQLGYTRFIVFFTIVLIPIKIALALLLLQYRSIEKE